MSERISEADNVRIFKALHAGMIIVYKLWFLTQSAFLNIVSNIQIESEKEFERTFMETARSLQRYRTQPIRKLSGSTHFHYDFVELGPVNIQIDRADSEISRRLCSISGGGRDPSCYNLTSSSDRSSHHHNNDNLSIDNKNDQSFTIFVHSNDNSWSFRRKLAEFVSFDRQLHRCVYDRRFSKLPELFSTDEKENRSVNIQTIVHDISAYFKRFSDLAGSLITCFPVLKWLELDSRGNHLFAAEETPINTPAVASAYVVRNHTAQNCNEISLNIGDIVSIIDMPDPSESFWWRGKLTIGRRYHTSSVDDVSLSVSCEVGFFPSECVQLFGNRIETLPLALRGREYDKPVFQRRKNFVSLFKNFLLTRPPRRRLKESGILMERVFGCDLAEHLINTGRDVPELLKFCCSFIEQQGIVDGIYRLSGAASNIHRLRCVFDEKRLPESDDLFIVRDVHCVASLLKMYFRELPNPLLTHHLYNSLVAAVSNQDHTMKILRLHDVIQQLPPPYFRTAEHLMKHLARIGEYCNKTGMTYQNLAIIWTPNLLRSHKFEDVKDDATFLLQNVNIQAVIVEYLIRYVDIIFSRKMPLLSSFEIARRDEVCSTLPRRNSNIQKFDSRRREIVANAISVPIGTKFPSTLGLPDLSNRKCIDVNGGPAALPPKYHTVLEIPSLSDALKGSKSKGWKTVLAQTTSNFLIKKASTKVASKVASSQRKRKLIDHQFLTNFPYRSQEKESAVDHMRHALSEENLAPATRSKNVHVNDDQIFQRKLNRRSLREDIYKREYASSQEKPSSPDETPTKIHEGSANSKLEDAAVSKRNSSGDSQAKILYRSNTTVSSRTGRKSRVNCKAFSEDFQCYHVPYTISVRVNLESLQPISDAFADSDLSSPLVLESQRATFSLSNDESTKRVFSSAAAVSSDFDLPPVFSSISSLSSVAENFLPSKNVEQQPIVANLSDNRDAQRFLQNSKKVAKVLPLNENKLHNVIVGDAKDEDKGVHDGGSDERTFYATTNFSDRRESNGDFWKTGSRITSYSLDSEIDAVCRQFLQNSSTANTFPPKGEELITESILEPTVASSSSRYNDEFLSLKAKKATETKKRPDYDNLNDLLYMISDDLNAVEKYSCKSRDKFGSLSLKSKHGKDADENFDHPRRLIKRLSLVETSSARTPLNVDGTHQFNRNKSNAFSFDDFHHKHTCPPPLSHRPTTKPVSLDDEMASSCSDKFRSATFENQRRSDDHDKRSTSASFYRNCGGKIADVVAVTGKKSASSVDCAVGEIPNRWNKMMSEQISTVELLPLKPKTVAEENDAVDSGDELIHCPLFRKQRRALAASLYSSSNKSYDDQILSKDVRDSPKKEQPHSNYVYFV